MNKVFLAMVLLSLAWTGCARINKMESNVDKTQKDVDALRADMTKLIQSIDDLHINQGGATSKMRADLTMLIKQLDAQLEKLHAEMDESQHRFRELEKKIDMLANQRLVMTPGSASGDSGAVMTDSAGDPGSMRMVRGLDVEKVYNQAREDYINGKYNLAFKGFKTVYEQEHADAFRDNALYWIGECFYKQEDWTKAAEYYSKCIKEFPTGNKTCPSYFKLGMVYQKQSKPDAQRKAWETLIQNCPTSNEAHRATELMKQ